MLVSQLSVVGSLCTCRPVFVGFVNGLLCVVVELKKPGVPARSAFDENLTHYKQQIPQLFPAMGLWAMRELRLAPESRRLAGGRR